MANTYTEEERMRLAIEECANEPIHISGAIQPHGYLLVLSEENLSIKGFSQNMAELLENPDLEGASLNLIFSEDQVELIRKKIINTDFENKDAYLRTINPLPLSIELDDKELIFDGLVHKSNHGFVFELEPVLNKTKLEKDNFYQINKKSIIRSQNADSLEELYDIITDEINKITGFDRVMLYCFDKNYNGQVVSEVKLPEADPFLGLNYPASDIPVQARVLYTKNWLRTIVDVDYTPSKIFLSNDIANEPLDLSYSFLRSVSPVHVQYLKNMGVASSMSISIIVDNKLWGLIACHHSFPKLMDYDTRMTAEFFGRLVSLQIGMLRKAIEQNDQIEKKTLIEGVMESLNEEVDIYTGLVRKSSSLMKLVNADGVAIIRNNKLFFAGGVPKEEEVKAINQWIIENISKRVYVTNCLSDAMEDAKRFPETASGLLAIQLSDIDDSRIIWFRKELFYTTKWAGKPHKNVTTKADKYVLEPRNSFEVWREETRCTSEDWKEREMEAAQTLQAKVLFLITQRVDENLKEERRQHLENQVKQRTKELTNINEQLLFEISERKKIAKQLEKGMKLLEMSNKELEHFAYVASHDLQEPLRVVASFSQLLERQYKDNLDEKAETYINFIVDGANRMKALIEDLLQYSRISREDANVVDVDLNISLNRAMNNLHLQIEETRADIEADKLPTIQGYEVKLVQLFQNLVGNSIKYSKDGQKPRIRVKVFDDTSHWRISISDNGIGINQKYADRIFIIFQRLHTKEEYSGTGIGLALCQKIVEQHGGRIWLDPNHQGEGTTFSFTVKKNFK